MNEVRTAVCRGESQAVDADLTSYFDTIPHPELMKSVARRISDRKMLRLIKMWLKAPVEATDAEGRTTLTGGKGSKAGTPQGGVLSPLLANIYIHRLLKAWKKFDLETKLRARIINYADDLVILCRGKAEEALTWLGWITEKLGLSLNEAKTRVCDAERETFDFLGYTFGPMVFRRTGKTYVGVTPSRPPRRGGGRGEPQAPWMEPVLQCRNPGTGLQDRGPLHRGSAEALSGAKTQGPRAGDPVVQLPVSL